MIFPLKAVHIAGSRASLIVDAEHNQIATVDSGEKDADALVRAFSGWHGLMTAKAAAEAHALEVVNAARYVDQ